jgi:hypothetical protein
MDLGALNSLVQFNSLNYSAIVFLFCVLPMFAMTVTEPRRSVADEEKLTLDWGGAVVRVFDRADVA